MLLLTLLFSVVSLQLVGAYWCQVWGDPHVVPFPSYVGQPQFQVWCQSSGLKTILKNKYVTVTAEIDAYPYVVKSYTLQFKKGANTLCTFTQAPPLMSPTLCGGLVAVIQSGGATIYTYAKANFIAVIYNQYNMFFWQTDATLDDSTGMCVRPGSACTLEGRRRKRSLSLSKSTKVTETISGNAAEICQIYLDGVAESLATEGIPRPSARANAQSACVQDVGLTGDQKYAQQSGVILAFDIADQQKSSNAIEVTSAIAKNTLKAEAASLASLAAVSRRFSSPIETA